MTISTSRTYDYLKRTLDVASALILLAITLPLQLVLAAIVAVKLGKPVLYRQVRPGKNGAGFTLLKFRSMTNIDEKKGLVSDEERLTPFGRKLRSSSLDELPSLWNVLRGDLSIVGPRPLLVEYLPLYTSEQARRHEVRPGVTGLAQVKGRNSLTWEEKFKLDVSYVDARSFALDAQILWQTVSVVLKQHGVSSRGHVTMSKFEGEDAH